MKNRSIFVVFFLFGLFTTHELCGQSVLEREVICSTGDEFSVGEISLSWTLGEVMADNLASGNIVFVHGFQQSNNCVADGLVSVEVDTLDCLTTETSIFISTSIESPVFTWIFPGGAISNEAQPIVNQPGIYKLNIKDGSGCRRDTLIQVNQNIVIPEANIVNLLDTLTCITPEIVLVGDTDQPNGSTSWSNATANILSLTNEVAISVPGVYTFTVTGSNGCSNGANVQIYIDTLSPMVTSVMGGTLDCQVDSIQLQGLSASNDDSFQWFDPQGFPIGVGSHPFVSQAGTYNFVVTNTHNGCTSNALVEVEASNDIPDLQVSSPGKITCDQKEVILSASSTTPGVVAIWSYGSVVIDSSFQSTVNQPGYYKILVYNPQTLCDQQASVLIEEDITPPLLTADDGLLDCTHPEVVLEVNSIPEDGLIYYWVDPSGVVLNENGPDIQISQPGTWRVEGINSENGCRDTISIEVTQDISLPHVDLEVAPVDCFDQIASLSGYSTTPNTQLQWIGPDGSIIGSGESITVNTSGEYTLKVIGEDGCSANQSAQVQVGVEHQLPNVITPNGDGKNDQLILEFCGAIPSDPLSLVVFNRWGQIVFESDQYDHSWGGDNNGSILPDGSYYYVVKVHDLIIKESLSILR